jgi:hypothetical protein
VGRRGLNIQISGCVTKLAVVDLEALSSSPIDCDAAASSANPIVPAAANPVATAATASNKAAI